MLVFISTLFLFFSSILFASHKFEDNATKEAAILVSNDVQADSIEKKGVIINKINGLLISHPDNKNVRNMYANVLISDRQYNKGLLQIEIINKKEKNPLSFLVECMLREKTGKQSDSCYTNAVMLSEKEKQKDVNYLMALYLAKDRRFELRKTEFLKNKTVTEEEMVHFNLSREQFLNEMFP